MNAAPARTELDERYGRARRDPRWNHRLLVLTAVVAAAIFVAWLIFWSGVFGASQGLDVTTTGHRILGDHAVTVRYQVVTDPGTHVACAVEALNEDHSIVGWKVVSLAPSSERARSFTETVRTIQKPTTGLIYRCWLT